MANFKKNIYILGTNQGSSTDPFRDVIGSYWVTPGELPEYGDTTSEILKPGNSNQGTRNQNKKVRKNQVIRIIPRKQKMIKTNNAPFYEIEHDLEIYSDKKNFGNVNTWADFVTKKIKTGRTFRDYAFDIHNPLASNELASQNFSPSAIFEEANFEYNYYSNIYEITTNNAGSLENILPNLYFFTKAADEDSVDDDVLEAVTAAQQVGLKEVKSLRAKGKVSNPKMKALTSEFFGKFGKAQRRIPAAKKKKMSTKYSNIVFDTNCTELFKNAESTFTTFPMGVDIRFMSDFLNEFTEILEDSKLSTELLSYLAAIPKDLGEEQIKNFSVKDSKLKRYFEKITNPRSSNSKVIVDFENTDTRMFDLFKWWQRVSTGKKNSKKSTTILSDEREKEVSHFEKFMYLVIFSGKLQTMIKKHQRSYLDMSDGAMSYSETFCYKIEKSLQGGSPIQTIWLPNTNNIDVIRYIDTQVKYNKKYKYNVTALQIVLGSEYSYSDIQFPETYDITVKKKKKVRKIKKPGGGVTLEVSADMVQADIDNLVSSIPESVIDVIRIPTQSPAEQSADEPPPTPQLPGQQRLVGNYESTTNSSKETPELEIPSKKVEGVFSLTDKDRFNTRFANDLFVLAKKREQVSDNTYYRANMKVKIRSSLKIMELPFFTIAGKVIDDPPVPPHVDIIPYRGVNNKLLFNLNASVGNYELNPVYFKESEKEIIDEIRKAKRLPSNSKIAFSTDDPISAFEIYRTTVEPTKIEDFADKLRIFLSTDIDSSTIQKASSASFRDDLEPNQTYYYTFRAIDIHNKVSNPTEVYKVTLVDNDGAVFPLIELHPMTLKKPQKSSKKGKKLLNIVPRLTQTIINNERSKLGDGASAYNAQNVMLGYEDRALFGEKFKIRLTSKKTGKKIDINVRFNVSLEKGQK